MAAKLDVSSWSVLVWCVECRGWTALAHDVEEGHDLAVAHELTFHPGCRDAYVNRLKWMRRRGTEKGNSAV